MISRATEFRLQTGKGGRALLLILMGTAFVPLIACASGCRHLRKPPSVSPDNRIIYYQDKVRKSPKLYPAHAALAYAYLEKARDTHDPVWLKRARTSATDSVTIQPNLAGFQAMAAICNFAHRFEESIEWSQKAAQAAPGDPAIIAALVESQIALGRVSDAEQLCVGALVPPNDFFLLVAQARIALAKYEIDKAVQKFVQAAADADRREASDFASWALIMGAGILIDAGRPAEARPLLDRAGGFDHGHSMLALHWAELAEAEERLSDAYSQYARLADKNNDPTVHERAFVIAKRLKHDDAARRHFEAAQSGYLKVIEYGEDYTRDALARLRGKASEHS